MTHHPFSRRLPRARIDPIADPDTAFFVLTHMMATPRRAETIAVTLDHEHHGVAIVTIDHEPDANPDIVFGVADWVIRDSHDKPDIGGVIIGSVRPGGSDELDDIERWLTLDDMFSMCGVELVEWFVFGRRSSCPRTLVGAPDRWAA